MLKALPLFTIRLKKMHGMLVEPYRLDWETSFAILSYDCSSCPVSCCSIYSVMLGGDDIRRLTAGLPGGKRVIETRESSILLRRTGKGACVLLKGRLCSVHSIKPSVCRNYPLKLNPASDGRIKVDAERLCPPAQDGVLVDEQEVLRAIQSFLEEYGDYYLLQSNAYRNLTNRLKEKHPMLADLDGVERLTALALRESFEGGFSPRRVYDCVKSLDGGKSGLSGETNPLTPLEGVFHAGVSIIKFSGEGTLEDHIAYRNGILQTPYGRFTSKNLKRQFELSSKQRQQLLDYLVEVSKRGKTSQYVIKSLRDGKKNSVFDAMGNYLFHTACGLAVYMNLYPDVQQAIASYEYSLKRRIDVFLS
jgi:Fe-S-cluster containining protein